MYLHLLCTDTTQIFGWSAGTHEELIAGDVHVCILNHAVLCDNKQSFVDDINYYNTISTITKCHTIYYQIRERVVEKAEPIYILPKTI